MARTSKNGCAPHLQRESPGAKTRNRPTSGQLRQIHHHEVGCGRVGKKKRYRQEETEDTHVRYREEETNIATNQRTKAAESNMEAATEGTGFAARTREKSADQHNKAETPPRTHRGKTRSSNKD